MDSVKNGASLKKRLYLIAAISFAVLYSLHALVLEPIYTGAVANVATDGILSDVLYYLCVAVELAAIYIFYAVAIFGIFRFGGKGFRGAILIFCVASVGKYLLKTAVSWFYVGAIPSYWYIDLFDVIYFSLLEVIQLLIIWAIVSRVVAKKRGEKLSFSKLYDGENVLMRASLLVSIVELAARLLLQISSDLVTIVMYGLPDKVETPVLMAISYLSTAIFAVLCYLAVVFLLSRLQERYREEKEEY